MAATWVATTRSPSTTRRLCVSAIPARMPPSWLTKEASRLAQDMLEYNDVEWNVLGLAGGPDGSWGREETDYLMGLCRRFDLRWQVIADRYAFPTSEPAAKEAASEGPSEASTRSRSVDQLKARYYGLAHTLILSRSESVEQAAHKELVKNPYNASAEADRRDLLTGLLTRTTSAQVDEDALLAAAAQVEARRKSEVDGARQAGLPLQLLARPAAVPPGGADVGGAAAAVGGKAGAAGLGLALGRLTIPDITLSAADIDTEADPGGPDLPTPRGQSQRPSQGCYARAAHTAHCSAELVVLGGAGTQSKPRDRKAGESFNKRIDLAMEELGVKPPNTGTRAVCRAWYALRKEVAQLLELRSQLARKSKESAAAAAVVAGVAGQPFSPLGGVGSPRGGSYPQLLSSPHAAGQPSLAGGFGAAPGAAGLLSPMDGGDGGRAQKRKAAPRHGDDDAVAPRPKKKR